MLILSVPGKLRAGGGVAAEPARGTHALGRGVVLVYILGVERGRALSC